MMALAAQNEWASSPRRPHEAHSSPFIVSTSFNKPNRETRKLIRSHVMRGKNSSRRDKAKVYGSWVNGPLPVQPTRTLKSQDTQLVIPRPPVCRDLETFTYADQLQPHSLELIFKCMLLLQWSLSPFSEFILTIYILLGYVLLLTSLSLHHSQAVCVSH